jgi:sphinganine C4-monooxygenase
MRSLWDYRIANSCETAWLHSRHHRLYVPYAYGALYNHPIEGFLLDTCGAGIGYLVSGMTTRQSMVFYTFSTIKTVDDHCGYALPWDPLQHITGNNAAYHDIHHQSWGIKTNFSQPYFTVWDRFCGTMWKGGDVKLRYERARKAAEAWIEQQRGKAGLGSELDESSQAFNGSAPTGLAASTSSLDDGPSPSLRRSPRKKPSSGQVPLKGLKDRMNGSLLGSAVPRVDSNR